MVCADGLRVRRSRSGEGILSVQHVVVVVRGGQRDSHFYIDSGNTTGCCGPLLAADQPTAPPPLRKSLHMVEIHVTDPIDNASLLPGAA